MCHLIQIIQCMSSLNVSKVLKSSSRSQHVHVVSHCLSTITSSSHHRRSDHRPHKKRLMRGHVCTTLMTLTNYHHPSYNSHLIQQHDYHRLHPNPLNSFTFNHYTKQSLCQIKITIFENFPKRSRLHHDSESKLPM